MHHYFLTLLTWIFCHMHHGYILTLMHMCMQIGREALAKCVIGILGLLMDEAHI
jgi:hypothetical protein